MSTYVLIHGAWYGGWVWSHVAEQLRGQGHDVFTPDLPGHSTDKGPMGQTMDAYVKSVIELLKQQLEPVILAGHSMGGAVISQAAEQCPEKVKRLVYVCAFMLGNKGSVLQAMQEDKDSELLSRVSFNEDQSGAMCDEATVRREVIYTEVPESLIDWAIP